MNNKRGELGFGQIMGIIILVLVLASIIFFIAKPDIIRKIRQLPNYQVPEDAVIEVTADNPASQVACNVVGYINNDDMIFITQASGTYATNLEYNSKEGVSGKIKYIRNAISSVSIGTIENKIIKIDTNIALKKEYLAESRYPSILMLQIIDRAYYGAGKKLCKTKDQIDFLTNSKQEIEQSWKDKVSNEIQVVFNRGIAQRDIAFISWDFSENSARIRLLPNGDNEITVTKGQENMFMDNGKIWETDRNLLRDILNSENSKSLSINIEKIFTNGRGYYTDVAGVIEYNIPVRKINNILYGMDTAPAI